VRKLIQNSGSDKLKNKNAEFALPGGWRFIKVILKVKQKNRTLLAC
jgi:hypothetical protein